MRYDDGRYFYTVVVVFASNAKQERRNIYNNSFAKGKKIEDKCIKHNEIKFTN